MLDQSGRVPFTVCGMGTVRFPIAGLILPVSIILFDKQLQDTYACAPLRLRNVNEMNMQVLDSGRTLDS
jgi:hypothetical protein